MIARHWIALGFFAPLLVAGAILLRIAGDRAELAGQHLIEVVEPGATVYCAGWIVDNPDQAGALDQCLAEQNDLALRAGRMLASLERSAPPIARAVERECRLPGDVRFIEGGFAWRIECYEHIAARHGATFR